PANLQQLPLLCANLGDHALRAAANNRASRLRQHPSESADAHTGDRAADDQRAEHTDAAADEQHLPAPTATELIAVAPGGEFRTQRRTDADEGEPIAELGETDVVSGNAAARVAVELLGLLDCFPAFLERRQVPPLALRAHDPEPPFGGIECQALPDRERFDRLIRAERFVAEQARRVHTDSEAP